MSQVRRGRRPIACLLAVMLSALVALSAVPVGSAWAEEAKKLDPAPSAPEAPEADKPADKPADDAGDKPAADATRPVSEEVLPSGPSWRRLAGNNRYQTMQRIVGEGFSSSEWAVVASGDNYPDALAAAGIAGSKECPVILTRKDALSSEASDELQLLGVRNVILMGGTSAMSQAVEDEIRSRDIKIIRIGGVDRQGTSVDALRIMREDDTSSHTVVLVSGKGFADALSIGPWAWWSKSPVVLVRQDGKLTEGALDQIKKDKGITDVLIIGGESAVSDEVRTQLGEGYHYRRLEGRNRFATSAAIADWEVAQGFTWQHPAVASGSNFPDALAAVPLLGKTGSPLLIANKLSDASLDVLREHESLIGQAYLLGGEGALAITNPLEEPPLDPLTIKANNFASYTNYLMFVDCTENHLYIFEGSSYHWHLLDDWTVSTGAPTSPTVRGEFTVGGRGPSFGDDDHTCYWWTNIYGDYHFHSVLYFPGTYNVKDGRMGMNISGGCVRMPIERAKWVYDTIPSGTKIYIY